MTIKTFHEDLAIEIKAILKDIITRDPDGIEHSGVEVYRQFLPKVVEDDEDISKFFPYALVRVEEATTPDDFTTWNVTTDILIGVFDMDPGMGGNDHVEIMIQRIIDRFAQEPMLCKKYRCDPEMNWALQDEDTYPYFFGGVMLKFAIPKIGRREPKYGH